MPSGKPERKEGDISENEDSKQEAKSQKITPARYFVL